MLAAVIVTFNRKELLSENIRMLLKQTRPFDKIFVVDNCSTDGTPEYLKDQGWMDDPRFVYTRPTPTSAAQAASTPAPRPHTRQGPTTSS